MTDRIDHAAEARRLNKLASSVAGDAAARVVLAAAQVHATLALVEQQRIANLIAVLNADMPDGYIVTKVWDQPGERPQEAMRQQITAALGIETGVDDD